MEANLTPNGQQKLTHEEIQIIALNIMALTEKEMSIVIGTTRSSIKSRCRNIRNKLNAHDCKSLTYVTLLMGFDVYGRYNGEPIFSEREQRLIRKVADWVRFSPMEEM